MSDNFPSIGEPVLDPNEKHPENGVDKYDLLLADGVARDSALYPQLGEVYGVTPYSYHTAKDVSSAFQGVPRGVIRKGSTYLSLDDVGDDVFVVEFDLNWVPTGFRAGIANPGASSPRDLAWDGVNFWVAYSTLPASIYKYNDSWGLVNTYGYSGSCRGITVANGLLWISDATTKLLREHTLGMTPTGNSFAVGGNTPFALDYDSDLGGIATSTTAGIYSYTTAGVGAYLTTVGNRGLVAEQGRLYAISSTAEIVTAAEGIEIGEMTSPDPLCPYRVVADLT